MNDEERARGWGIGIGKRTAQLVAKELENAITAKGCGDGGLC